MRDAPGSAFHVALGRRLESLRKRMQFTGKELAERIGVSQQCLHQYETAERRVPTGLLLPLAEALRVPVTVLIGVTAAPALPKWRESPQQRRHLDQLRKLPRRDRVAVMRITQALARLDR